MHMLRLELRKQRLAFFTLAVSLAVTAPAALLGRHLGGATVHQAAGALVTFWIFLALPLAAVLLGAAAGAGARSEPALGAETPLPLSPSKRAGAAALVGAVYLAALCAAVFAAALALDWAVPGPLEMTCFLLPVLLPGFLLASCTCAFLMANGVAGGLAGTVVGGAVSVCLIIGFETLASFDIRGAFPFFLFGVMTAVVSLAGGAWALVFSARRLRRDGAMQWRSAAISLGMLCVGPVAGLLVFWVQAAALARRPMLVPVDLCYRRDDDALRFLRSAENRRVLVENYAGEVAWMSSDGERERLLADDLGSPWQVLRHGARRRVFLRADMTPEGELSFGTDSRESGRWETQYWWSPKGEALRPGRYRMRLDYGRELKEPLVQEQRDTWRYSDRRAYCRPYSLWGDRYWSDDLPSVDIGWSFACPYREKDDIAAWLKAAGRHAKFLPCSYLNVVSGKGKSRQFWIAPCGTNYKLTPLPDGTSWGWRDDFSLHVRTAEGEFVRPLFVWPALSRLPIGSEGPQGKPFVLHRDGDGLWLLAEGRFLAKVSLRTGGLAAYWKLPDGSNSDNFAWHVVDDGFFLDTGRGLYFVRWDGSRRKLG